MKLSRGAVWFLVWASAGLVVFLGLPLLALVMSQSPRELVLHLRTPQALTALSLTLRTTALATLLCIVFGTPVAYLLARVPFRGREVLDTLTDLPITIPPVVAGVALLLAFGRMGLVGRSMDALGVRVGFTTAAVVMAQVFIASPFYVKAARAGFESVDTDLEQVALTMGASPWHVFRYVTVPLARASLFGGVILAWARALSEFGATMMFAGNFPGRTQTLTLAVMSAMEADMQTATAIATLSLLLALATLLTAKVLLRRLDVPGG